jgi:hypothetical protein
MVGRSFLDVARELAAGPGEARWRSSVGRAYYGLLHAALDGLRRWGFSVPPRDRVHVFARLKLVYATDRTSSELASPLNLSVDCAMLLTINSQT